MRTQAEDELRFTGTTWIASRDRSGCGRKEFESQAPIWGAAMRGNGKCASYSRRLYAFVFVLMGLTAGACLVLFDSARQQASLYLATLWIICALPLVSEAALALIIAASSVTIRPRPLPRLDLATTIPDCCRTLVVIPTILTSPQRAQQLVAQLESHYLHNREHNILFALLNDFPDAAAESTEADHAPVRDASRRIDALNAKYGTAESIFFLLQRPRRWSPAQGTWMGRERKRGKLEDLNALLLRGDTSAFCEPLPDIAALGDIAYVITLDSDTGLPGAMARRMIEAMAYQRSHSGEGRGERPAPAILQPAIVTIGARENLSLFEQLHVESLGSLDLTAPRPDFYQEMFAEGSYYGKAIYDAAAFDRALRGELPEDWILSHDLIEGYYAGAVTVADTFITEDFPRSYLVEAQRAHRWMRGDWQLLPWLLPELQRGIFLPRELPRLSALSRWKILDNLRRSLLAPSTLVTLVLGWTTFANASLAVVCMLLIPIIASACATVATPMPRHSRWRLLLLALKQATEGVGRACHALVVLPHRCQVAMDAIVRSLWRMLVTRRYLLEWLTSHEADENRPRTPLAYLRALWMCPLAAVVLGGALQTNISADALIVLSIWVVAPMIVYLADRPRRAELRMLMGNEVR